MLSKKLKQEWRENTYNDETTHCQVQGQIRNSTILSLPFFCHFVFLLLRLSRSFYNDFIVIVFQESPFKQYNSIFCHSSFLWFLVNSFLNTLNIWLESIISKLNTLNYHADKIISEKVQFCLKVSKFFRFVRFLPLKSVFETKYLFLRNQPQKLLKCCCLIRNKRQWTTVCIEKG